MEITRLGRGGSPKSVRTGDSTVSVLDSDRTIGAQKYRAIEVDQLAQLSHYETGCHGERSPDHIAYHGAQARSFRFVRHGQGFGQSAALVQLDIHDVETIDGFRKIRQ
jgi:hypothetical protein